MDAGRYPDGASDDAADASAEETTLSGDEGWPVAEQYRVEPREHRDEGTIVLDNAQPTDPPGPARRFPPELGRGVTGGLVAALLALLLIPAGFWLASRSGEETVAATGTGTTAPQTQPPTNTTESTQTSPSASAVPDVTGRLLPEARAALNEADLRVRFRRADSERPLNEVLEQAPAAGIEAQPGTVVVLTVSGGEGRVAVPDVGGTAVRDAVARLRDTGLRSRTRAVPAEAPPGSVVAQSPAAGEEVAKNTVVVLDIAEARSVAVPAVVGTRSADARSRLSALGLRVTQRPVESPRPAGEVVSQSPAAGAELREGGVVTLRVSTGTGRVEVADVVGLEEAAAVGELELGGFVVRVIDEPTIEPAEDGVVLGQSPAPGTSRRKGTTVTITVGRLS